MLSDAENGDHDAVAGHMAAVTHQLFLDTGQTVDKHPSGLDRVGLKRALTVDFQDLAVFQQKDLVRLNPDLTGQSRVADQMAVFAVDGNEVARPDQVEHQP